LRLSRFTVSLILLLTTLVAPAVFASGFSIFEQGAKATGMGGAFAATADDPSAMFYNVAGIAYQRKTAALFGATIITFENEFRGDNGAFPGPGVTGQYQGHVFTPPNVYAVVPIGDNATFGIATFSAYGLRTNWADANRFAGRFLAQDTNLKTVSIQPSFAIKLFGDKLALGAGVEYRGSHVSLERNQGIAFNGRIFDVAHARLDSENDHAFGYTAGLLFKLDEKCRLGLSYRSDMDIDYKGDATFTQISTGNPQLDAVVARGIPPHQNIKTGISYPSVTALGLSTEVIPTWNIEFDTTFTTWSRFKTLTVDFANPATPDLVVGEKWKDTYSFRLGANHPVTPTWDIRLGGVFDQSPQPVAAVNPLLPDADRYGASFGVGYHGEHLSMDLTEFFLAFGNRNTVGRNPDNFNGTYKTTANLIGVNFGYKF